MFSNFLKRYISCRIFFSTTYQNLEMAIPRYRELLAGKECETEKNPLFLQWSHVFHNGKIIRSRLIRPQLAATNIRYASKLKHSLPKLYFTLIILTNYYSAEIQEIVFTPALSSSCVLSCHNYAANIHFGVAKKSKTSLLYLGNC